MADKTEAQKKVLQDRAVELYETFVEDDPDLMVTDCACCEDRRKLVGEIQQEFAKIQT